MWTKIIKSDSCGLTRHLSYRWVMLVLCIGIGMPACAQQQHGNGVDDVLEQIVAQIPAPEGNPKAPLKALIFDSLYDSYKGVIVFCRIKEGTVRPGTPIKMMATGATADVVEVGYFGAG